MKDADIIAIKTEIDCLSALAGANIEEINEERFKKILPKAENILAFGFGDLSDGDKILLWAMLTYGLVEMFALSLNRPEMEDVRKMVEDMKTNISIRNLSSSLLKKIRLAKLES